MGRGLKDFDSRAKVAFMLLSTAGCHQWFVKAAIFASVAVAVAQRLNEDFVVHIAGNILVIASVRR